MAIESPLFQSSMELLGHSISHFNGTTELDRKLLILHLSNSVELLLKDMVLDVGESIYKNPKETITIHGCFDILKGKQVSIPYLNKVELLIDERNALQHRFGSPNELTAIFYMNISLDFFRTILKQHYSLEFDETIAQFTDEKDLLAFRMREPSNDSELENLKKLAKVHPLGALLSAITYMEKTILEFAGKIGLENDMQRKAISWNYISSRYLEYNGVSLPLKLRKDLDNTRHLRNLAAHGRTDPTKEDVVKAIKSIEELEKYLAGLDLQSVREQVEAKRQHQDEARANSSFKTDISEENRWLS